MYCVLLDRISHSETVVLHLQNATFGDLFVDLVRKYGILCLGLFRLLIESPVGDQSNPSKRYVLTKPAAKDRLRQSDHVFVLMQSDYKCATESQV